MNVLKTRNKLIDEISRIPDERLPDIYNLIHYFRLGLNVKEKNPAKILKLAGSWRDMPEEDFDDFLEEIRARRKNAFLSRRNRETSVD